MAIPFLTLGLGEAASPIALDLIVILAAASAVTLLLGRLRITTIPGYLVIGAIIGPHALGLIESPDNIEAIGGLATVLLLFTIGLHLDVAEFRGGMMPVIAIGVGSTLATTLIGWPICMAFSTPAPAALAISMAIAMSSTAVILRLLQQRREMHSTHGRLVFAVLLVQDLLAVVALALMPMLGRWAGTAPADASAASGPSMNFIGAGALALGGTTAMIVAGKVLLPRILMLAMRGTSTEALVVISATVAIGAGLATAALGLSAELGAFLAGFLLASTPVRYHVAGQIAPLRDLFMAVFFTTVGLDFNPAAVATAWWAVILAVVVLIVVKGLINGVAAWLGGATGPVVATAALLLANAGEFTLVLLGEAARQGVVQDSRGAQVAAVVVVSLILAPVLANFARRVAPQMRHLPQAPLVRRLALNSQAANRVGGPEAQDHIIIAGFGVVGRAIADHLALEGRTFFVVELNPKTVHKQTGLGRRVIYGDIANREVLEAAGIHEADAIILTIPDEEAIQRACAVIRALAPSIFIAARAPYLSRAISLSQLGADLVTVEEVATAERMVKDVIARLQQRARVTPSGS